MCSSVVSFIQLVLLICFLVVVVSTTKIEARVIVGSTDEDRLDFMYNEDENKDCSNWVAALSTSNSKSNIRSNFNNMTTEKQKRCNMEWKGELISNYWCPKTCSTIIDNARQQQQQHQQEQQSQSEVPHQVNNKRLPSYDEVMNHNNDDNAALVNVVVPNHGRYVDQSSGKSVTSFCARHNKFNKRDCQQHHAAANTASYLRGGRGGGNIKQKDHKQNGDDNNDQQKEKKHGD